MHRLRKENLSINKDYLFKLLKKSFGSFLQSKRFHAYLYCHTIKYQSLLISLLKSNRVVIVI